MRTLLLLLLLLPAALAQAADRVSIKSVSAPGDNVSSRVAVYEGEGGTSCANFLDDILPWQRRGGDWRDAGGALFGSRPYATSATGPGSKVWDVTNLVKQWRTAGQAKGTFFLRAVAGAGYAKFHSREAASVTDRPMLALEFAGGRKELLNPTADTVLDCSTYMALGRSDTFTVSSKHSALLEYALPATMRGEDLIRAHLILSSAASGSGLYIGVFDTAIPAFPAEPVSQGLAASYPADRGIEKHPDVIFATGFDEGADAWKARWAKGGRGEIEVVADDKPLKFAPLSGSALEVNLKKDSNLGFELRLYLKEHGGEADELYFRYYLRFAEDWNPNIASGKLPGLAGTYGQSGWGGRRADGSSGWSLRGAFLKGFPADHPMRGLTQLATYAYHADMNTDYGDIWTWPSVLLSRNRWYCIEQYVRLNHVGASDGVLRVWLDGHQVLDRPNIRMRTADHLHIEAVWLNAYHGGTAPSPHNQHFFIDNVVVARRYIGPLHATQSSGGSPENK